MLRVRTHDFKFVAYITSSASARFYQLIFESDGKHLNY